MISKIQQEIEEINKINPQENSYYDGERSGLNRCLKWAEELEARLKREFCKNIVDDFSDLPCDICENCLKIEKQFRGVGK